MRDSREHTPPVEFRSFVHDLTREQFDDFSELVTRNAPEREIDAFFRERPALFTMALACHNTGHNGTWVFPQQTIRSRIGPSQPGLIPDYLLGGRSSDGFSWWVVELKGADARLFASKGEYLRFSETLNRGICQTLGYIDYCAEVQSHLRDQLRLSGFREPKGIILIGRETEVESDRKRQQLKAAWNRLTDGRVEIRTYDSLLRSIAKIFGWRDSVHYPQQEDTSPPGLADLPMWNGLD